MPPRSPPLARFTWNPNPTANPSTLTINLANPEPIHRHELPSAGTLFGPAKSSLHQAGAAVAGISVLRTGTAKDPATWQTNLCVPVFDTRPLQIIKTVTMVAPATMQPVTTFTVNYSCSLNGIAYRPNQTAIFTAFRRQSRPEHHAEHSDQQHPAPSPKCRHHASTGCHERNARRELAYLGPGSTYPDPHGPNGTSQSVAITTGINSVEVHNTFACVPVGSLIITKIFDPSSPASQFPPTSVFPVLVICPGLPNTVVNLTAPNFQQTVSNIPTGTACTIAELTPTGTNAQSNCYWDITYPQGQSVIIPNGSANLQVRNALRCFGTLTVYKTFDPTSLGPALPSGAVFPVQISCTPGTTTVRQSRQ